VSKSRGAVAVSDPKVPKPHPQAHFPSAITLHPLLRNQPFMRILLAFSRRFFFFLTGFNKCWHLYIPLSGSLKARKRILLHTQVMADYGDIIGSDDSDAGDELEENAEDMRRYWYEPLYYPMRIGQVLDQRYRIEHKLGHGGFSTVWMAHDSRTQTDVALKVLGVTASQTNTEIAMHREIRQRVTDTSRFLLSQHTFSLSGPMGTHRVLVFPLQGPNLQRCFFSMSLASRMSIAEQVLKALESLHNGNIVHRGLSSFPLPFCISS
jgi:hypothetical protein